MFIAALITTVKIWKPLKFPQMDKDDVRYTHTHTHTMGYYSVIKKEKEILSFATTLIKLEGIRLSKISQRDKEKYCMISLKCRI